MPSARAARSSFVVTTLGLLVTALPWTPALAGLSLVVDSTCLLRGESTMAEATLPRAELPVDDITGARLPVRVDLSSSNPSAATVPESVILFPDTGRAAFEIIAPSRCISLPGRLCPGVTDTVISATGGSAVPVQRKLFVLRDTSHLLADVRVEPSTVIGGAVCEVVVELSCPAPPDGVPVEIGTIHPAVESAVESPVVPAGESELHVTLLTHVVPFSITTPVSVTVGGRREDRPVTVLAGSLDLTVRAVEVTQGIQVLEDPAGRSDNSLPLVTYKPLAVRVYLEANTSLAVDLVPVRLWSRPCGGAWVEHSPLWPTARIDPGAALEHQRESPLLPEGDPSRATPQNVTFLVGPRHLNGLCRDFRAEVDPDGLFDEDDETNNTFELKGVTFEHALPLNVKFVQVDYCPGCPLDPSTRLKPRWDTIYPVLAWIGSVYPVSEISHWKARREVNITSLSVSRDFRKEGAWNLVLIKLATLKALTDDEASDMHYYGMLHPAVPRTKPSGFTTDGMGYLPPGPRVAVGVVGAAASGATAAHEIAHNVGRRHAPCGDPDDVDPDWPPRPANALIGHPGFDIGQGVAVPASRVDFMSYCPQKWISPYTWDALHLHYTTAPPGPLGLVAALEPEPSDHILLRGFVDREGQVTLLPSYHVERSAGQNDGPGSGPYSVVLRAAGGEMLFGRNFAIQAPEAPDSEIFSFFEIIPWHPDTARVEIRGPGPGGESVLGALEPSQGVPVVEVLSPNGGESLPAAAELEVTWQASDPDGDPLAFAVEFSADNGMTWEALETDLEERTLVVSGELLPGTDNGLVRVIASDGLNTASDDSDDNFTVEAKAPEAVILEPGGSRTLLSGQPIQLHGTAFDAEDGALADGDMTWDSSLDGRLGEGRRLVCVLSPGVHLVTLEVIDRDGNTDRDTVTISVVVPDPENPDSPLGFQIPGDCNQDRLVDLSDAICLLSHIFLGDPETLPCERGLAADPANVLLLDENDDGLIDISDSIHMLEYLFLGGPGPVRGTDCVAIPGCPDACPE